MASLATSQAGDATGAKRAPPRAEGKRARTSHNASKAVGQGQTTPQRDLIEPAAFRELAYRKGWTLKALAGRWGHTLPWLIKLIDRTDRPQALDDALRGLPRHGRPKQPPARWSTHEAEGAAASRPTRLAPGLRYQGYMVVGAVVAAQRDVGSMAEEGAHGIVVQVLRTGGRSVAGASQSFRVIFESGAIEVFTPDLVDQYLVTTGLERQALAKYQFVSDEQVIVDFEAGMFEFW